MYLGVYLGDLVAMTTDKKYTPRGQAVVNGKSLNKEGPKQSIQVRGVDFGQVDGLWLGSRRNGIGGAN